MNVRTHRTSMSWVFMLATAMFPLTASAQVERTVGDVVRSFRRAPNVSDIGSILAQRVPGFTAADRDALADSLVSIALGSDPILRRDAMTELTRAAVPRLRQNPYPGSLERLRYILEQAPDTLVKISAFGAILDLVPAPQSEYDLLREWVTLPGVAGALTLAALADRCEEESILYRPEMKPVLRRVIEAGGFTSRHARTRAEAVARENGWRVGGG